MKPEPIRFMFDGEMRKVSEIHAMVGGDLVVSDDALRRRLKAGATTKAKALKPLPTKGAVRWNARSFGKGHMS